MKWVTTFLFFFVVVVWAEKKCKEVLPLAERCDEELCKPPHCRCSSARTPGDLAPEDTPQVCCHPVIVKPLCVLVYLSPT